MERAPHNPWGITQDTRKKFVEGKQFPIFDGTQEWLFWLGCGLNFDSHGQNVAFAMKRILDSAGLSWGVLARESCCGEPARRAGNEYLYLQLAEELIQTLTQNGVKKIVSCCPHCTTMLDKDYRQIGAYAESRDTCAASFGADRRATSQAFSHANFRNGHVPRSVLSGERARGLPSSHGRFSKVAASQLRRPDITARTHIAAERAARNFLSPTIAAKDQRNESIKSDSRSLRKRRQPRSRSLARIARSCFEMRQATRSAMISLSLISPKLFPIG